MIKSTRVCDLCDMDGDDDVEAIAFYMADDKEDYDVCKKHLEQVKEQKLPFELYDL